MIVKFWISSVALDVCNENVDDYRVVFEVEVDVSSDVRLCDVNIEPSQIVHFHFIEG
jgi:hypothetical protein